FGDLTELHEKIQAFEAARSYADEWHRAKELLDPRVSAIIADGWSISLCQHLENLQHARIAREQFDGVIGYADYIVAAAAPGEAPIGAKDVGTDFRDMGSPSQSRAWTLLHVPAIAVPCTHGPNGLPVGIQIIG